MLQLQKTIGNSAVQELLRRAHIQPKLAMNEPGDIYEQEADLVANQVVSSTQHSASVPKAHAGCDDVGADGKCGTSRERCEPGVPQRKADYPTLSVSSASSTTAAFNEPWLETMVQRYSDNLWPGLDSVFGTSSGTLTVTNLASSGPGTLRYLLSVAATNDTINFAPGLSGTLTLSGSQLAIDRDLTIIGPGAPNLTIIGITNTSGPGVLEVYSGSTVKLSGMTLGGGRQYSSGTGGGAVHNGGSLNLTNCVISGNEVGPPPSNPTRSSGASAFGGAIFDAGALVLVGCTVSSNLAIGEIGNVGLASYLTNGGAAGHVGGTGAGGAIYNSGTLTALNCSFVGNITQGATGGTGGAGGTYQGTN